VRDKAALLGLGAGAGTLSMPGGRIYAGISTADIDTIFRRYRASFRPHQ